MKPVFDRLSRLEKPIEFAAFFLFIVLVAAALNEFREILFYGDARKPFSENLLRSAFTAVPLAAFGTGVLIQTVKLRRELEVMATTDQLTGLPNRRHFSSSMQMAIAEGRRGVLLMADVDNFKMINDNYGHPAGDKCLQVMADAVRATVRKGDLVARVGGEEFAVFLPDATIDEAQIVAQRLVEGVCFEAKPHDGQAGSMDVTLSVGAAWADGSVGFEGLMRQSDAALYAAKDQGRARVVVHGEQGLATAGPVPA